MNGLNWRGIRAVMFKDLTVVMRSKAVVLPTLLTSVILMVVIPVIMGVTFLLVPADMAASNDDIQELMQIMPDALESQLAGMDIQQMGFYYAVVFMFAPMYLIIPVMTSSVMAADSFVGERERKTLEALLHTPITNTELMIAKLGAAWIAAIVVSVGAFLLYCIATNLIGFQTMGGLFFPNWMWIILVFWVGPAVAAIGLGAMVLLSTRVKTFQEAYQSSGFVVVPLLAIMFGQIAGVIYLSNAFALLLGLGCWVVALIVLVVGAQSFDRDRLFASL